jgi:hypothetical protein
MFLLGKKFLNKNFFENANRFNTHNSISKYLFSRKCKPKLKKIKRLTISKTKTMNLTNNSNKEMIVHSMRKLEKNLDEVMKIMIKKTIDINDEDFIFVLLTDINNLPLNKIENKFFFKHFSEGLNKLRLNTQKNIIQLINFIDKFQISPLILDFKSIEKKILMHINFLDPDSLLKTLILFKKFSKEDFTTILNNLKIPIERILNQYRLESLSMMFYYYSLSYGDDLSFLIKISKEIAQKLNNNIVLSNVCITRITVGILNKFKNKYNLIHPNIWAQINDDLIKADTNDWIIPSYQFYLLSISHYSDKKLFEILEKKVFYSLIDFNSEMNEKNQEKFEGLIRTMCSYSVASCGSSALWMEFFKISDKIFDVNFISLESINLFIEILLNKQYIYNLFKESENYSKYVKEVVVRLTGRIEKFYLSENIFSVNCSQLNIQDFCENVIKSDEFSEEFSDLCVLILEKIQQSNKNSLKNNL